MLNSSPKTLACAPRMLSLRILTRASMCALLIGPLAFNAPSLSAQSSLDKGIVKPMGQWAVFAQADFTEDPIEVHLRTGYERTVILPEPVSAYTGNPLLPNTEVIVDNEVVGFYPELSFKALTFKFVGAHTGTVYELVVKSSTTGSRQPLKVNR